MVDLQCAINIASTLKNVDKVLRSFLQRDQHQHQRVTKQIQIPTLSQIHVLSPQQVGMREEEEREERASSFDLSFFLYYT
jgi:hypothetical protein